MTTAVARSRSPIAVAIRRTMRSGGGRLGALALLLVIVAGFCAPLLTALEGQNPSDFNGDLVDGNNGGNPYGSFGGVSGSHWFGVEPGTGRDLFALVAYGLRTTILIALAATIVSVIIGAAVGMAMGYLGGWFEAVLGRFVDFMFGFPSLLFLIALQLIVPADIPKPVVLAVVLAAFGWVGTARLIHTQTKQLAAREFIDAAKASGTPLRRVFGGELLPNLVGTLAVVVALSFPATVAVSAGLSFLGVGIGADTPDLGVLIGSSITWTYTGADAGYLIFPSIVLLLIVLGATLLGDALRDAFDVRTEENAR
ncbi:MAG TPA: ABC transporter permease [Flexivirga sp.]|uniref:ABC transporter permease n=1 Tax=Flexivirga sp. TaxID=1962927 RepID=UPI002D0F04A0|nr:ABC transporter permease [Flexivirga sp.]HWC23624.1 ABC transporter permease [Flexivirga sp.]